MVYFLCFPLTPRREMRKLFSSASIRLQYNKKAEQSTKYVVNHVNGELGREIFKFQLLGKGLSVHQLLSRPKQFSSGLGQGCRSSLRWLLVVASFCSLWPIIAITHVSSIGRSGTFVLTPSRYHNSKEIHNATVVLTSLYTHRFRWLPSVGAICRCLPLSVLNTASAKLGLY